MTIGRHDDPARLLAGAEMWAASRMESGPGRADSPRRDRIGPVTDRPGRTSRGRIELPREMEPQGADGHQRSATPDGTDPIDGALLSVLEELPGFAFIQARDHSLRWANRLAREEFGDFRGRACYEIKRGRTEPCVVCPAVLVFETGQPEHWDWTDRRGRSFRMCGLPLISADGEPLLLAHGLEVTAQNRLESALQEAEDRFRLVLDNVGLGVIVVQNGRIKLANDLLCRLSGYTDAELTSGSVAMLLHPDDRDMVLQRHVDRIAGRQIPKDYQCRVVLKDKSVRWITIRGTRFYWEGEPATLIFINDITEAKRIEEQGRVAVQEKEVVVREMHQHLKNNIRLLSGVLSLEAVAGDASQLRHLVKETQSRLAALSLIHDVLYRSRLTTQVELKAFASNLTAELHRRSGLASAGVESGVEGETVYVGFDRAVVCGLIINESLRLAAGRSQGGPLRGTVSVGRSADGRIQMGFTLERLEGAGDLTDDHSLGLNLVRDLVAGQLDGRLETFEVPGIKFVATFQP
jgi:PAS domain S-box-containing protein